jgi:alpha-tubulin suppressor-like RCC1 family protein
MYASQSSTNIKGQLGPVELTTADRKRDLWSPFAALSDTTNIPSVTSVAAGGYHSIALTQSQEVFTWGDNTYGQLGGLLFYTLLHS